MQCVTIQLPVGECRNLSVVRAIRTHLTRHSLDMTIAKGNIRAPDLFHLIMNKCPAAIKRNKNNINALAAVFGTELGIPPRGWEDGGTSVESVADCCLCAGN